MAHPVETCAIIKIRADNSRGFRIINAGSFDPSVHVMFDVEPIAQEPLAEDIGDPVFTVARGPRGLWYIRRNGAISGGSYATEDDAQAALSAMQAE